MKSLGRLSAPQPEGFEPVVYIPRLALKGFLVGLLAGIVMLVLMGSLRFSLSFLNATSFPEVLAEAFTRLLPASTFDTLLETLQTWAKTLMFIGLLLGIAIVGGGLGLLYAIHGRRVSLWRERPLPRALILSPIIWGLVMLFILFSGALGDLPPGHGLPFALIMLACFLVYTLLVTTVVHNIWQPLSGAPEGVPVDEHRRAFLKKVAAGAAVLVAAGLVARVAVEVVKSAQPAQIFGTKGILPPEITPNDQFYVVSKNIFDIKVNAAKWKLDVGGLVDAKLRLNLDEVTALPAVEQFTTLICISNEIGGDLVSNARWRGVPLSRILSAAGLKKEVTEISFRAADGYSESIPLERAMRDEVLVAYEMNGEPLNNKHGAPVRLLVPGLYGLKSVKWLTRIVAEDSDFQGYWQVRDWTDDATIHTISRIDVPVDEANLSTLQDIDLGGITFAGLRGVDKVEVSVDGGATWQRARLKRPLSSFTWQLWTWQWRDPPAGEATIVVRATDGEGKVQTAQVQRPFPEGATGYHSIRVELV